MSYEVTNESELVKPDDIPVDFRLFSLSVLMGALIGLGQLLSSETPLSLRMAVGRAFVSAGLAACAPAMLIWAPNMPIMAEFALAAFFASAGTSGLQAILHKFTGTKD